MDGLENSLQPSVEECFSWCLLASLGNRGVVKSMLQGLHRFPLKPRGTYACVASCVGTYA